MKGYVYSITFPSNKRYIGITTKNPKTRYREHISHALYGNCGQRKIYKAINKYGADNLKFEVLVEIEKETKELLLKDLCLLEQKYINDFDSFFNGYNCTLGGEGTFGLVGELNQFYGKKHTPETINRLKELASVRKHTEETKRKISEAGKGRKHSKESIEKMKQRKERKQVICLDTNDTFNSSTDCSNHFKIARSDIRKVCEGERITAHGMKFRYIIDGVIQEVQEPENKRVRKVKCVQTGKVYDSIKECCADLGVRHQHVSAILRGRQKTTRGYSFIYN